MKINSRKKYVEGKIGSLKRYYNDCGGTYGDVTLIFNSIMSGMATECWPGKEIDRKRFIEILVLVVNETANISIPRFLEYLDSEGKISDKNKIKEQFMAGIMDCQVIHGKEVDSPESMILPFLPPDFKLKHLRQYSYASILYSEIRCGYSHEAKPGKQAASRLMSIIKADGVSYETIGGQRLVYFNLEWLADILIRCAEHLDNNEDNLPLNRPSNWWAEGVT